MPSDRIDLIRRLAESLSGGDVDALVAATTEDVVFLPARSAMEGAYVGHDGLRRFVADNDASFELFALRIDELHETGDQVVAVGTVRVRGRGVGTETEVAVAGIFEFRGEKISRWEDLRERGTALAAAGLSA